MSSKGRTSAEAGDGAALVPKLRFPEFQKADDWETAPGNHLFQQFNNREVPPGLPILAITQEHGAIPRHMIDYHVSVTDKSLETYKEVRPGDFIISLRSFQGGIEFSDYHGICSPAYVILRKRGRLSEEFYRQHFKSHEFIQQLTRNIEGLRDGKMISYKQFSELQLLKPTFPEQQKIAACLNSADALIIAQGRKVEALRAHKTGLMQQLFPQEGETQPRLRFPEFEGAGEWEEEHLESLAKRGSGHTPSKSKPEYYDGGVKWISLADSKRLDRGLIFETEVEISAEGITNSSAVLHKAGSVLISRDAGIGKSAVMALPMAVSQHFIVWTCDDRKLSNWFLYHLLQQSKPLFDRAATGSTIKTIGLQFFIDLRFRIPSRPEQQRIADCLNTLDDLIAAETRKLDTLKTHKKGLMQQLFPQVRPGDT
ncbi:restriction endonuclease subunit S [Aurantimonas sp. VKM B-3413]|uniref:restriction endonuclease subunit S n=1 Tax=Aurantimonas sp. VKM B-3413 TaxID=2779401 RepID=UPI001E59E5DA|nr:restriction endonuclease subunit S [Aurantimonas sp. VKM B-3413]MCB8837034.1 restriction endonuclease subunit S [Aurantimonas sp. VKM B-3413]